MRVLIACEPGVSPYVDDLAGALRCSGIDVEVSLEAFWLQRGGYDLVHIQWPEGLFRWQATTWAAVGELLNSVLPVWRRCCPLVITRHNAVPHVRDNMYWQALYRRIYSQMDGVVHLGEHGVEEFKGTAGRTVTHHSVIPLHATRIYGEAPPQEVARRRLRIGTRRRVVLVFGSVRHPEERVALLRAFRDVNVAGRLLIVPSFGSPARPPRKQVAAWFSWEWQNREWLWPRRLRLGQIRVPDDKVACYFAAADVVLIPRLDTLNSAVVPLAFQYGCPVVGPEVGNIGKLLRAAGNRTFDPSDPKECARAVTAALRAGRAVGDRNRDFAERELSPNRTATLHADFYRMVVDATAEMRGCGWAGRVST